MRYDMVHVSQILYWIIDMYFTRFELQSWLCRCKPSFQYVRIWIQIAARNKLTIASRNELANFNDDACNWFVLWTHNCFTQKLTIASHNEFANLDDDVRSDSCILNARIGCSIKVVFHDPCIFDAKIWKLRADIHDPCILDAKIKNVYNVNAASGMQNFSRTF